MRRLVTAILVLGMLLPCLALAADYLEVDPSKYVNNSSGFLGYVPDRFIVILKDNISVNHQSDLRNEIALNHLDGFPALAAKYGVSKLRPQFPGADRSPKAMTAAAQNLARHYKVYIERGELEQAMEEYRALPWVEKVEPIGIHTVYAAPNDGYYDNPPPEFPYDQWHYWDTYGIEADVAWDSESGDPSVLAGVLDIGVMYDHGDLGGSNPPGPNDASTNGNIFVNPGEIPGNGIDDDGNGYVDDIIGWDFVERTDWYVYSCVDADCGGADNDPRDGDGHGTHVAGTIAAITNNGYAVAGVAGGFGDGTFTGGGNGVKIVPCRIGYRLSYMGSVVGVVIMDYVAEAMYYMADLKTSGHNVAAINCSFGTTNSGGLGAAADYLIAQDVVICVAAGNSSSSSPDYLGGRGDCLDVAATDNAGNPASFTNYGSWVDIAAPGVEILSTITDPADPTTDYISAMDGTSMACPHAVGVVALLESFNPSLSASEKIAIITDPANTKPYNGTRDLGAGIIDAAACIAAAGPNENPPVAAFTGSPTSGDYPLTVNFVDQSSNTPTSWSWDFGDGVGTSTQQNPSYTYNAAGTYTVSLTAYNAYGSDIETKVDYITVTAPPPPTADFTGSPASGEAPLAVNFTDQSIGSPVTWSWDFGDGVGTSAQQNPSYTYDNIGTYTVSLTVTNDFGSDTETKVNYITVTEPGQTAKVYAGSDISVSGTVSGSFMDTYASDNAYETITEIEYTGHPRKRYSYLEHKWTFDLGTGGSGLMFYLEGYRPNNTDGDNFTFAYSTDNANFTTMFTVASATEQVYSYDLPDNLTGTIYVRVVDSDRNWDRTSLDPIYVDEMYVEMSTSPGPPVANFSGSPTTGVYPLTVNFSDLSTGNPTSWSWDFGDGSGTSTQQNPSYTYNSAGTYTVSLTATNAYGSDVETKIDYITVSEPSHNTMHVHDIIVTRKNAGPNCNGQATIYIYDSNAQPVASATVYATATGPVSGNFTGTTASDGSVFFETSKTRSCTGEWCFEVTNVTHATNTYNSAANQVTKACESGWVYRQVDGLSSTQLPTSFELLQNHPNPFNPTTNISFTLPTASNVALEVFNIVGQKVAVVVSGYYEAGYHTVTWDATNMPSGVYLYHFRADSHSKTMKMLLLK